MGKAYCYPTAGGETEKNISDMMGYTCFSPQDTQILLEWIKRNSHGKPASSALPLVGVVGL